MELIIKEEQLDIDRIIFRIGKHSIKLLYDLGPILIIGLCIKIKKPFIHMDDETTTVVIRDEGQQSLFKKLDSLFSARTDNYTSFFQDNGIRLRNSKYYSSGEDIYININNIKNINGRNCVNVFSL